MKLPVASLGNLMVNSGAVVPSGIFVVTLIFSGSLALNTVKDTVVSSDLNMSSPSKITFAVNVALVKFGISMLPLPSLIVTIYSLSNTIFTIPFVFLLISILIVAFSPTVMLVAFAWRFASIFETVIVAVSLVDVW